MLDRTIGDVLEQCCASHGPRHAVVQDDVRVSYDELIARVRSHGRALLALGLEQGDRVAVMMSDRPELLYAYYGAAWAGLTVVPLNPAMTPDEQSYVLSDSGARALCHDADHRARVSEIRGDPATRLMLLSCDADGLLEGAQDFATLAAAMDQTTPGGHSVDPDELVAIYYAAGGDGLPKGVAHSHRTYLAATLAEQLATGLGEREVFAHTAPMTQSSCGFVVPVWLGGGTNVLLRVFEPERFLDTVDREQVTATLMSGAMLGDLLDHPGTATADTSSLRSIVYGAEPLERRLILRAMNRFGPVLVQVYGQPEAPDQLTVLTHADHAEATAPGGDIGVLSSCGRPVTMARIRLVDDAGDDVPRGEVGEIVARGPHLMLRYWNRPQETAQTLRNGWLYTGDAAREDERGFLYIVDRAAVN